MKKALILVLVLFLYSTQDSFSQFGHSKGKLTSLSQGRNISSINASVCGQEESGFAGVIVGNIDNVANTTFYCLDLCTGISIGDSIIDSASTIPQAIYITRNYFPGRATYPGKMSSDNDEACAVQMAIWHFRNGLNQHTQIGDISGTTNDSAIKVRTDVIIADVNLNGGTATQISTIAIKPGVDPDEFYIETKDTTGNPISVSNISLTLSGSGSLSTYTVSTNAGGVSPNVVVTGADNGDVITATAVVQVPGGVTYAGLTGIKQLLVLSKTTTANRTAQITWGALPVELSSFTSIVNNSTVTLNWTTATESNNSGFNIERKSTGSSAWQVIGNVTGHGNSSVASSYSFTDRNLATGSYNYRLKQMDFNGNFEYFNLNSEVIIGTPTGFSLNQNYPNPFNPSTNISFNIPKDGFVSVKVYDNLGKEVASLVNDFKTAGYYTMEFNASNLTSGVYFYKMETAGFTKVLKMSLIK